MPPSIQLFGKKIERGNMPKTTAHLPDQRYAGHIDYCSTRFSPISTLAVRPRGWLPIRVKSPPRPSVSACPETASTAALTSTCQSSRLPEASKAAKYLGDPAAEPPPITTLPFAAYSAACEFPRLVSTSQRFSPSPPASNATTVC